MAQLPSQAIADTLANSQTPLARTPSVSQISAPVVSQSSITQTSDAKQTGVAASPAVYQDIMNAVSVNLPSIDLVGKQASLLSASTDILMKTLSAARPNLKPFIVGFIVPDVPINYLPISQVKNSLSDITAGTPRANAQPGQSGKNGPASISGNAGTGQNPVPAQEVTFKVSDFKKEIENSLERITGKPANPWTANFIMAQMRAEWGISGNTFRCRNYNIGNFQAGGNIKFLDKVPTGNEPIPVPDQGPSTTAFLGIGYTGKPQKPYSCWYQSWNNLSDAVYSQIQQLTTNWPNTVTAMSVEQYNQALIAEDGHHYYGADPDTYLRGLKKQLSNMGAAEKAPTLDPTTTAGDNVTPGAVVGAIMDNGDVCQADLDPLQTSIGRNIRVDADRKKLTDQYLQSIRSDIEQLRQTKPLLMLVNPSSFDRAYEPTVDSGAKGRQGHVVQMWLEHPFSISCKGVTAGQYAFDQDGAGGLVQTDRVQSLSYQNLLSLVYTYRNNGVIFDKFTQGSLGVPILAFSVYIYYDNHLYIGSFDDFTVDDSADKPYNMEYSFKFNVRYDMEVPSGAGGVVDSLVVGG